jgi:hypothetical protein
VKFESNDVYDYTLGDASKAYKGILTKFNRHVVHIKPGIFVLFDELEAPKPVNFEWWLHALSEIKFDKDNNIMNISQGDARLKVKFLQSAKVNFSQIKGFPDAPPEHGEPDHYHAIATTSLKSTKTNYITLLLPFKKDHEPEVKVDNLTEKQGEVSMVLSFQGKKYLIGFEPKVDIKLME